MRLLRDSLRVLLGMTTQRFLSIVMIPVVTWLLGPGDYGIFNIAASLCVLCSVIGGLALETSIAVSDSKRQAWGRALGTSALGVVSGFIFLLIAYFSQSLLARYYSREVIHALLWMVPLFVPLTTIGIALQNYVAYLGEFQFIAIAEVVTSASSYATFIVVYFLGYHDYRSLIVAAVLSAAIRIVILLKPSRRSDPLDGRRSRVALFREIWGARRFMTFNFPCNVLNTANVQLPPALISTIYPESVVGLFIMARNIIMIPASLSGQALGQVFYPKAAKEYREGRGLQQITWDAFRFSCQLTLFPTLLIVAAAGFVLPLVLGRQWDGVALYIVLLLPMVLLSAIETQIGIGFIFNILNQQPKILWGNLLLFVCRIGPFVFCLFLVSVSVYWTILSYSIGGALGYAILLVWILGATSNSVERAVGTWVRYFLLACLCVSPLLLYSWHESWPLLGVALAAAVLLYGGSVWFLFLNAQQRAALMEKVGRFRALLRRRTSTLRKLV